MLYSRLVIELAFYGQALERKKIRALTIIYDPFNLLGNRIDIRDFPDVIYVFSQLESERDIKLCGVDKWQNGMTSS